MASETTINTSPTRAGRSLWADAWMRIAKDRTAVLCIAVILLYAIVAVGSFAYQLAADLDPNDNIKSFSQLSDYTQANKPPSIKSPLLWFGTDWAGRSVLLKTILGAKVSLSVGLISNLIAVPLGMILGVIAGYYGKFADAIIVWIYSTLATIPGIILLIAIRYAFKGKVLLGIDLGGLAGLYVALGVMSWIGTCRLVRAEVLKIRELDYVTAAKATGTSTPAILLRHIIPNVLHLGLINFSLGFVGAVTAEVILSYLGLGVPVGVPSWGSMIDAARMELFAGRWWELSAAVIAMFFLILALNLLGDRLRDALDPKLRNV